MTPAYVPRLPRRYAKHARGRRGERAYVSLRLPRDIIERRAGLGSSNP